MVVSKRIDHFDIDTANFACASLPGFVIILRLDYQMLLVDASRVVA